MAYSAYTDIQDRLGTTLSSTVLNSLIASADRQIDGWLAAAFETGVEGNDILKEASVELACSLVKQRDAHTGARPRTLIIGPMTRSSDVDREVERHVAAAKALVAQYVAQKRGDPNVQSAGDFEEEVVRKDHLMGQYQLDQSTETEYNEEDDEE